MDFQEFLGRKKNKMCLGILGGFLIVLLGFSFPDLASGNFWGFLFSPSSASSFPPSCFGLLGGLIQNFEKNLSLNKEKIPIVCVLEE